MAYRHLIPLDGSKLSEEALGQLAHIAAPGAAIQLLSAEAEDAASEVNALSRSVAAGHDGSIGWPPIAGMKDPHAADTRVEYLSQVKEWLEAAEYEVRVSLREGNIIDAILEAAKMNEVTSSLPTKSSLLFRTSWAALRRQIGHSGKRRLDRLQIG